MSPIPEPVVSVVAPLRNAAGFVTDFLAETHSVLRRHFRHYELVLVDDASSDRTADVVATVLSRYTHVRLLTLSRPFGVEAAITAGLDAAIGDVVVVLSPDTDPPDLIPALVRRCVAGSGVVFGVRSHRRGERLAVRLGAALFYWLCRRLFRLDLPPHCTHLRALSRQAVHAISQIKDRRRSLWVSSAYIGYGSDRVRYEPQSRSGALTGRRFFEAVELAVDVVAGTTTAPLRLAARAALAASAACFLGLGYIGGVWLLMRHVAEGWTSLSLLAASMFAVVLAVLGIASEYLARLLDESRDRPLYFVREERTSPAGLESVPHRNVLVDPPRLVHR